MSLKSTKALIIQSTNGSVLDADGPFEVIDGLLIAFRSSIKLPNRNDGLEDLEAGAAAVLFYINKQKTTCDPLAAKAGVRGGGNNLGDS